MVVRLTVDRVEGYMMWVECKGEYENQVEVQVDLFTRDRDLIVVLVPPIPVLLIPKRSTCSRIKRGRELSINQPFG